MNPSLPLNEPLSITLSSHNIFNQQAHEKDKKKEKEVLTKCHCGGGEGCEEAGLQVNDFGILGFLCFRFSPPSFLCLLPFTDLPLLFIFCELGFPMGSLLFKRSVPAKHFLYAQYRIGPFDVWVRNR